MSPHSVLKCHHKQGAPKSRVYSARVTGERQPLIGLSGAGTVLPLSLLDLVGRDP